MIDFYSSYFADLKNTLDKIDLGILEKINTILYRALLEKKQVFTMGNGGSGSTASHFVCDLNKGVCYGQQNKFKAICLNDNIPTLLAYANDVSYTDIFSEPLKNLMQKGDIVIGFSGSGNSENIIKAIEYAKQNGGITVGFSGCGGGRLAEVAEYSLVVPIDDMQKSEDIHFVLCHLMMQSLMRMIRK